MKQSNKKEIYGGALMARLEQIGVSAAQASVEMGFSEAYLSMCFKRGWMPEYAVRLIRARFGIKYEEFQKTKSVALEEAGAEDTAGLLSLILEELRAVRAELQTIEKMFE